MAKADEQKQRYERYLFEKFSNVSGELFDRFESLKPPEPDIRAWRGENPFGIEITRFYRQAEKARESEEDNLVELARHHYESKCGIRVHVDILWSMGSQIARSDRERLAIKIASLVVDHVPPLRSRVRLDWASFGSELVGILHSLTIDRVVDYKQNLWNAVRSGCAPRWQEVTLQKELDRKKGKRPNYQQSYTEVWLLLVSTFSEPSSWLEMTDSVSNGAYESEFDRVFLLSSFPHQVFKLRLRDRGGDMRAAASTTHPPFKQ